MDNLRALTIIIFIAIFLQTITHVKAESIPKPSGTYTCHIYLQSSGTGASLQQACDNAWISSNTNMCPNYNTQTRACNNLGTPTENSNPITGRLYYTFTQTSQDSGNQTPQQVQYTYSLSGEGSCPSGYSDNGSTCTRPDCASGQKRDTSGSCVSDCSLPFRDLQGATFGGSGSSPSSLCVDGCSYTPINSVQGCKAGNCKFESHLGKPSGANCSGSGSGSPTQKNDDNRTPDEKCISQGQGFIETNGVITCVGAGTGGGGDTTVNNGIDPPVTFKDGGGVDTNSDGVPDKSNDNYCKDNPTAKTCNGSFTGNCTTGFICDGDAAQCAIARLQYDNQCDLKSSLNSAYNEGIAAQSGASIGNALNPASIANRTIVNVPTTLSEGQGLATGSLSDYHFNEAGIDVTIPFSRLNDFLIYMGYIVLAFGYFNAARIVGLRGQI